MKRNLPEERCTGCTWCIHVHGIWGDNFRSLRCWNHVWGSGTTHQQSCCSGRLESVHEVTRALMLRRGQKGIYKLMLLNNCWKYLSTLVLLWFEVTTISYCGLYWSRVTSITIQIKIHCDISKCNTFLCSCCSKWSNFYLLSHTYTNYYFNPES